MELALGTVQFGLRYGVAGRDTAVPSDEARAILRRAADLGVRLLDTASAYGDIEPRLAALADGLPLRIVSKLPACPAGLDGAAAAAWARAGLASSIDRLGAALAGFMFHRAEDLLELHGDTLWQACRPLAEAHGLALGVSCYAPDTLELVRARYPIALAQLPGNALDQRLASTQPATLAAPLELHLRSAFLQGLLLMPQAAAVRRVPAAATALARWHAWCGARGLPPLVAALGLVKGLPAVSHCVVGVDDLAQLEEIAAAWGAAQPLWAPELQCNELAVVDPRQWPPSA
jgi:aryl-alcohol dehydrogenase-like predicted oxidoreductase